MDRPPVSLSPLTRRLILTAGICCTFNALAALDTLALPPRLAFPLTPQVCETPAALDDLKLQDAVHIALCQAPNVRQATQTVEQHLAEVDVARAKFFPTLNANVDASRSGKHARYPAHPIGNQDIHVNHGQARLGLNWLLFDSGRRGAQIDHARAELAQALYNRVLVNRTHAIHVANTYYKAASTHASATAAREAAARAEKNFLATQRLREGGVGSIADELLAQVAWQRALVDRETKASHAIAAKMALASAMGLAGRTPLNLPAPPAASPAEPTAPTTPATRASVAHHVRRASEPTRPTPVFADQLIAAVRHHPRLAVASAKTQAATAEAQVIHTQNLPSLSLQANRDLNMMRPAHNDARQNLNSWSVGLTLQIPIFDGMATRHATDAAQAKVRAARDAERDVWLEEELALLTDVNHLTSTAEKADLLKVAEASAEQAYRSARVRYQQGVGTAIELLKAQDELSNIQQSDIEVRYELLATQFRVAVALDALPTADASHPTEAP